MKHVNDYLEANTRKAPKYKTVSLENPWTGGITESGMTWAQILTWSKDAFDAGDCKTLGAMILGS